MTAQMDTAQMDTAQAAPAAPAGPVPADPVLAVEGLDVRYGASHAVRGVDLTVRPGERIALVGESGSGKSTLGLAVAGFIDQRVATVEARRMEFAGVPLRRELTRLPQRTPGMSMVFQDAMTSLDPLWTVGSQLVAVLRGAGGVDGRAEAADAAREWLTRVGLTDTRRVMAARPHELSGGMRQRVMTAIALAGRPRLLVADEPTSALDASLARGAVELLVELCETQGASVLMISHDIGLCRRYTDRTLVMHRGVLVEELRSDDLGAATHPYTRGLLRCIPTLASAGLDELPTMTDDELGIAA
ncbi:MULTISPECIES: ABC transporter ATP-binding protein [unclassified Pseudonocardia]|uniref:ATP-binding cassette domain-containing protein n=1 Tax=unclassified Pseudonocardia TaxID=2619320 RepID=UPI0001FFE930|nr:ABC transporter ATP-binding protein [Pseudonocardia sp. Ae707_Ps1]OLM19452.1 Oligopeptide transport ATP-binding protein OppD [Pseudonocardia sp. Ae707_Ps1]